MRAARSIAVALAFALVACRGKSEPAPAPAPTPTAPVAGASDPWGAQPPKPITAPVVTDPLPHPFVWSATKNGKTTTLFGTIHVGVEAEAQIPTWVWKRFDAATTLVTEVDFKDLSLSAWTIRPEGPALRDELGDAYWNKFEAMVGPPRAMMLDLGSTAQAAAQASGVGHRIKDTAPMDGMLRLRAEGLGKRLVFLESATAQSELLSKVYTVTALRTVIDNRDELPAVNRGFFRAYEQGDGDKLDELGRRSFDLMSPDEKTYRHVISTMLTERNRAWLPELEKLHAAGGAFVAVGALHLLGEDSVLEMLEARGYTVQRLVAP